MGTDFWTKVISKDKKNPCVAFENIDGVTLNEMRKGKIKPGYKEVNVHVIFYIKMNGKFTRKTRFVANGHTTAPPSPITY